MLLNKSFFMKTFRSRNIIVVSVLAVAVIVGVMLSGDRLASFRGQVVRDENLTVFGTIPSTTHKVDVPNYKNFTCEELRKLRDSLKKAINEISNAQYRLEIGRFQPTFVTIYPGLSHAFTMGITGPTRPEAFELLRRDLLNAYKQLVEELRNVERLRKEKNCQEVYDHPPIHLDPPEAADAPLPLPSPNVVQEVVNQLPLVIAPGVLTNMLSLYLLRISLGLGTIVDYLTAEQIINCLEFLYGEITFDSTDDSEDDESSSGSANQGSTMLPPPGLNPAEQLAAAIGFFPCPPGTKPIVTLDDPNKFVPATDEFGNIVYREDDGFYILADIDGVSTKKRVFVEDGKIVDGDPDELGDGECIL
jgi:hypothetical protein